MNEVSDFPAAAPPAEPIYDTQPTASGPVHAVVRVLPFLIAPVWVGLLFYSNLRGEPFNVSLEDGLLEWGSVFFFIVCGFLAVLAAVWSDAAKHRPTRIFLILFALGCVAAAGEELSWGQRILGFKPPETSEHSVLKVGHGDAALHNLTIETDWFKFSIGGMLFGVVLLAGLAFHGIWLPIAHRRGNALARRLTGKLGVFVPPLELGILLTVLVALVWRRRMYENTEANEYKEFIVPLVYAYMLCRVFFSTRSGRDIAVAGTLATVTIVWLTGSVIYFARG